MLRILVPASSADWFVLGWITTTTDDAGIDSSLALTSSPVALDIGGSDGSEINDGMHATSMFEARHGGRLGVSNSSLNRRFPR